MANIAAAFYWPPGVMRDMSLEELMSWHERAVEALKHRSCPWLK